LAFGATIYCRSESLERLTLDAGQKAINTRH
jgi:hypothetical protein